MLKKIKSFLKRILRPIWRFLKKRYKYVIAGVLLLAVGGVGTAALIIALQNNNQVIEGAPGKDGKDGRDGVDGKDGQDGMPGTNGSNGSDGTNGSSFLLGSGVPDTSLGSDGDSYLDQDTNDLYKKEDGSWTKVGSISGGSSSNSYTVTFDSDGGSAVTSQTVKEGNKITVPDNPTKDGYTFNGWELPDGTLLGTKEEPNSFNFYTVSGNITLKARFTLNATTPEKILAYLSKAASYMDDYEVIRPISISLATYTPTEKALDSSLEDELHYVALVNDPYYDNVYTVRLSGNLDEYTLTGEEIDDIEIILNNLSSITFNEVDASLNPFEFTQMRRYDSNSYFSSDPYDYDGFADLMSGDFVGVVANSSSPYDSGFDITEVISGICKDSGYYEQVMGATYFIDSGKVEANHGEVIGPATNDTNSKYYELLDYIYNLPEADFTPYNYHQIRGSDIYDTDSFEAAILEDALFHQLTADFTLERSVAISKEMELDFNGHTITISDADVTITNSDDLFMLYDLTSTPGGITAEKSCLINVGDKLVIHSGNYSSNSGKTIEQRSGRLFINKGTFSSNGPATISFQGGNSIINDGTFTNTNASGQVFESVGESAVVDLKKGSATTSHIAFLTKAGDVTVRNLDITGGDDYIFVVTSGKVYINGVSNVTGGEGFIYAKGGYIDIHHVEYAYSGTNSIVKIDEDFTTGGEVVSYFKLGNAYFTQNSDAPMMSINTIGTYEVSRDIFLGIDIMGGKYLSNPTGTVSKDNFLAVDNAYYADKVYLSGGIFTPSLFNESWVISGYKVNKSTSYWYVVEE